jgi:hypothetical protein
LCRRAEARRYSSLAVGAGQRVGRREKRYSPVQKQQCGNTLKLVTLFFRYETGADFENLTVWRSFESESAAGREGGRVPLLFGQDATIEKNHNSGRPAGTGERQHVIEGLPVPAGIRRLDLLPFGILG